MKTEHGNAIASMLQRVFLGGKIEECLLVFDDGTAHVEAIDLSNTVYLMCAVEVPDAKKATLGIGDLGLLCKYLGDAEGPVSLEPSESRLTVKRRGRGMIRCQLLEPKEVPTALEKPGVAAEKLSKGIQTTLTLKESKVADLLYHINLVRSKSVFLGVAGGTVMAQSSPKDAQQFKLTLGKVEADDMRTEVYGEFLTAVLQVLTFGEKDEAPELGLSDGGPVVISQGGQFLWALTPVAS